VWTCNAVPCAKECAATGESHYRTFDNLPYTFPGHCQYVLSTDACGNGENYTFAVSAHVALKRPWHTVATSSRYLSKSD